MVETDIANCFEAIPHDGLMQAVEERVCDRAVLKLLRAMLRAGVMERGRGPAAGDRHPAGRGGLPVAGQRLPAPAGPGMATARDGVLVRYADDLVVMCRSRGQAEAALARLTGAAGRARAGAEGGQDPDRAPGGGWRGVGLPRLPPPAGARPGPRGRSGITFLARWPSRKAMQHARDRIRELTARSRLLLPVEEVVQDVNRFLRGWAGYFRYGNSARHFDKIRSYALMRLALFVRQAPQARPRAGAGTLVVYRSPNQLGPDQPQRNRRRAPGPTGLAAGRAECRR